MNTSRTLLRASIVASIAACAFFGAANSPAGAAAPVYGYEVVNIYPHDGAAFTEGLIFGGGFLYEGTGTYGHSWLRKVELETGEVLIQHDVPTQYFGEGITALRDTLYQLTWNNHIGFRYVEKDTFALIETYSYQWEGWGLTHNGTNLIASDGSEVIRFLDPNTREEISHINVTDDGQPVYQLNELEYIQNHIYANVWHSEEVVVIDPASGAVEARLDLGGLCDSVAYYPNAGVLNGIAFDSLACRLFVTGKRWPLLFEIDVPTLHAGDVSEDGHESAGREKICLFQNPFDGRASIQLVLAAEGPVALRIFDSGGRLLRTLLEERLPAGRYTIDADVGLPAGAYLLSFSGGPAAETQKIIVVR